ncbi:MAG: methionyl-tRNA formyltransferase [Vicinamibacterales bacterium]
MSTDDGPLVLFVNNRLGLRVARWLAGAGEPIAGFVLHPPGRRKEGEALEALAASVGAPVLDATELSTPGALGQLTRGAASLGVSVMFGYVLRPPVLGWFGRGVVNLHPSWLPHNRGAFPNVWPIVEGTPAGATLHWMDAGVDTGPIIARVPVPVRSWDTGESLYERLEAAAFELFRETWPAVRRGTAPSTPQEPEAGSTHRARDVERIDCIDLDAIYRARDLLNVLRSRTFSGYRGAYYVEDGRRVYLDLRLAPEPEEP